MYTLLILERAFLLLMLSGMIAAWRLYLLENMADSKSNGDHGAEGKQDKALQVGPKEIQRGSGKG